MGARSPAWGFTAHDGFLAGARSDRPSGDSEKVDVLEQTCADYCAVVVERAEIVTEQWMISGAAGCEQKCAENID